ncbi:MAG: neutral/alkaline non-lysosomal ceramidase N-terminal domain-containing protein [Thermoguttaceae bacterium]|nr:neutral/alkaline non-lysosomal ceramidase N-terminal domain-containing protein [Thermoguttaceae bacterium]MDW8079652.1 neutral/alkaline non-lysosomal ceramidase N-terminal domain-containing protein [Thermoguttaceae bacterium]
MNERFLSSITFPPARAAIYVGVVVLLAGVIPVGPAVAQQNQSDPAVWKVGLARVDITPTEPIWLAGYAARNKPSEGVLAPLFAKAMLLEDFQGNRGLIITLDIIGFRENVAAEVARRIEEKTGLKREQVLICFSHTHTGPIVSLGAVAGYSVDEPNRAVIESYTRRLIEQLGDLAASAAESLRPAGLQWGVGVAPFVMNRREFIERGVRIGFNPRGYVDRSVPVLKATSPEGESLAVLFGYACHNTTLTGQHYVISGDYAGFAQAKLEEELPGVQAMFVTGCAADANPHPRGEIEHARQHGSTLAAAVREVLGGPMQPVRGPLKLAYRRVDLPLQQFTEEQLRAMAKGPDYLAGNARRMLEMLEKGEPLPKTFPAPIAVWQFGTDLTLVALPAEVVSDYALLLDSALGHLKLWVAAYCNEVFGYIPSAKVLSEGGYECRGVYVAPGFFAPEVEEVIVKEVREMAAGLGRPVPENWYR